MSYDDLPYFRDQILERIDSLKCFLSNTPPLMANLMTVSTVSRTEERLKQVKPIRVSVKDDASVEEIIQALTDICVDDIESLSHDSTKVTTKYPGLIIAAAKSFFASFIDVIKLSRRSALSGTMIRPGYLVVTLVES